MNGYTKHLKQQYSRKTFSRKVAYVKYNFGKELIKCVIKEGSILEIGPGMGECVAYANELGINLIDVVDNDKDIVNYLVKKYKIRKSYVLDVNKISNQLTGKYDIILMIQVLEHVQVEAAVRMIKLLYSKLNIDGELMVVVPNANNPLGIVERYGDIQHTTSFTEQSLKDLITQSQINGYDLIIRGYEIPPYNLINIIRIIFQKILHVILLLLMVINGGTYFKTMTPNITMVVKKVR